MLRAAAEATGNGAVDAEAVRAARPANAAIVVKAETRGRGGGDSASSGGGNGSEERGREEKSGRGGQETSHLVAAGE